MRPRKVATILGARPQFVKAALVSHQISRSEILSESIIHTGQHYDPNMDSIFFEEMNLPKPLVNLGVSGGGHGAMTGTMMIELEKVLIDLQPDIVLIYGDTNSTLAASLVAAKLNIPIAHVEGGLRNNDPSIPEELNRIIADRLSSLIFCSTQLAMDNLLAEGFQNFACRLFLTGDLMYDAAQYFLPKSKEIRSTALPPGLADKPFVLCTIHRAHNTEQPGLSEVFSAINALSESHRIIFPIHPRTKAAVAKANITLAPGIISLPPVGYLDMLSLLSTCDFLITDSGGLQKEGYAFGKRSLLLIDYTPWAELVHNQYSVTCDSGSAAHILEAWEKLSTLRPSGAKLYGNGASAELIVRELEDYCLKCKPEAQTEAKES